MPRIAAHHQWKDPEHVPSPEWPEDCLVQWGGDGLVVGANSRVTAFFEAFPGGSFIRGEGKTIRDAELDALAQYRKKLACPDHHWQRGAYTNGGAICKRCGCFETRFKEIVRLGGWRAAPSMSDLSFILGGTYLFAHFRALAGGQPPSRYDRARWLRLRAAGIDLPAMPTELSDEAPHKHAWTLMARDQIMEWATVNGYPDNIPQAAEFSIAGIFSSLDDHSFRRAHAQWLASRNLQ